MSLLLATAGAKHGRGPAVQRLLVRIDPSAATERLPNPVIAAVRIEGSRPPTGLKNAQGHAVQGDHTTAWTLIQEEVAQAIEGKELSRAYDDFWKAVSSWHHYPWAAALFEKNEYPPNPIPLADTLHYLKLLERLAETYLRGRNSQPGAAYASQPNKSPKVSMATGTTNGETKAINHLRALKSHPPVSLGDKSLVNDLVDLFDPPYTGPLKGNPTQFLKEHLAPRIADQVTSAVLVLGPTLSDDWTEPQQRKFMTNLVTATLVDMQSLGIYGVDLKNDVYIKAVVADAETIVDWNGLGNVVGPKGGA